MIALAIEKWGLHRRMALLTLLAVGTSPARLIGGFMLATALVSMWISNTATTVMMLPIGLSVVALFKSRLSTNDCRIDSRCPTADPDPSATDAANFATCLLLGIAYAASLGGFATLVGTPPNVFFKGYMRERGAADRLRPLDALRHAAVAGLSAAGLVADDQGAVSRAAERHSRRPRVDRRGISQARPRLRGEWIVLIVFLCTAALWISAASI